MTDQSRAEFLERLAWKHRHALETVMEQCSSDEMHILLGVASKASLTDTQLSTIFAKVTSATLTYAASKVSLPRTVCLIKKRSWLECKVALRLYPEQDYHACLDLIRWLTGKKGWSTLETLLGEMQIGLAERELMEWNDCLGDIYRQAKKLKQTSLAIACLCCLCKDTFMAEHSTYMHGDVHATMGLLRVYSSLETSLSALGATYERVWLRCFPPGRKTCHPDADPATFKPFVELCAEKTMSLLLSHLIPALLRDGQSFDEVPWKRVRIAVECLDMLISNSWEQLCQKYHVQPQPVTFRLTRLLEYLHDHFLASGFLQRGLFDQDPVFIKPSMVSCVKSLLGLLPKFQALERRAYLLLAQLSLTRHVEISQACQVTDEIRLEVCKSSKAYTHPAYLASDAARQFEYLTKHLNGGLLQHWVQVGCQVVDRCIDLVIPFLVDDDQAIRSAAMQIAECYGADPEGLLEKLKILFVKRSKRRVQIASLMTAMIGRSVHLDERVIIPCIVQLMEEPSDTLASLVNIYYRKAIGDEQRRSALMPFRLQTELWQLLASVKSTAKVEQCLAALCHRLLCPPAFARPETISLETIVAWCHGLSAEVQVESYNNLLIDCPSIVSRLMQVAYEDDLYLHFEAVYDEACWLVYRLYHGEMDGRLAAHQHPFLTKRIASEIAARMQQVRLTSQKQRLLRIMRHWCRLQVKSDGELWDCLEELSGLDGCDYELRSMWRDLCRFPWLFSFTARRTANVRVLQWIAPVHPDLAVACLVNSPHLREVCTSLDQLSEESVAVLELLGHSPPCVSYEVKSRMAHWLFGQTRSLRLMKDLIPLIQGNVSYFLEKLLPLREHEGVLYVICELCAKGPPTSVAPLVDADDPAIFARVMNYADPSTLIRGLFWPHLKERTAQLMANDERLPHILAVMEGRTVEYQFTEETIRTCVRASGYGLEWCRIANAHGWLDYDHVPMSILRQLSD